MEGRLQGGRDGTLLEIADDGRGISEREIEGKRSLGILGMRERANIYGGEVALGTTWEGEIRLGRWMRRPEALVVLAHEYGHAWQDANHPRADRLSERFSEGFASWSADVVARQTGYRRLAEDVRRRSGPVYQEGLVAFRNWERTLGVRRLLELARTWVDFTGEGPLVPAGSPPEGNVD